MARIITALVGGAILGILATLAVTRISGPENQSPHEIVRDIVDVPKMAQAAADKHRDDQYANLSSITDVFALPTEFTRSEAVYALAGRSNSAGIQNMIFETSRIADEIERVNLLKILFFRLAESDPQSALALARVDSFKGDKSIEQIVWHAWARNDLEDALFAAKSQTSLAHQNTAAQSLYEAFGFMGNETTDRIEAELGIGPDRSSRGRYLYRLADESPAAAIAFINGLERGIEQQEYVSWLAYYLTLQDPAVALGHASLFESATHSRWYREIINSNIARENPRATIDRFLASGRSGRSSGEFHSAIRALASTDLDAATQYFEQVRSGEDRQIIGSVIVAEMAKNDPLAALAWARANERGGRFPVYEMTVLSQLAQTDPQTALAEAQKMSNAEMRSNMVANVIEHIAQKDPVEAIVYLDQIQDRQQKTEASQQLVSSWMQQDPEAAIEWILRQDEQTAAQMIQRAGHRLFQSDIDAAIRLLPRIDDNQQASWREQIAQRLAMDRSPGEARGFISQFEGQPGYDRLQASMISGVAMTDTLMAKQLADQLSGSNARDTAYVQVISQHAQTDPHEAARWLSNVSDERLRNSATAQLAQQWHAHDPSAATRWVSNLPAGSSRDSAILQLAYRWGAATKEQQELIASIANRNMRGQAKVRQVYKLMATDPAKARQLLEDEDISKNQRQQAENRISRMGLRH